MDYEEEDYSEPSIAKQAAQTVALAATCITLVYATAGLAELAYDWSRYGLDTLRAKKAAKKK